MLVNSMKYHHQDKKIQISRRVSSLRLWSSAWFWCICLMLSYFISFGSAQAFANEAEVKKFVDRISKEAISIIHSNDSDDKVKGDLGRLFERSVDIDWISKFVLGQQYNALAPEKKMTFGKVYREFLINKYVPRFRSYNVNYYQIVGYSDLGQGYHKIVTKISENETSTPLVVEYRIKVEGGNTKIRDITVEGVSMILTQRSDFSHFLHTEGIDKLINRLQRENG